MSRKAEQSNDLYDAIVQTIDEHKRGMTTYQIIGTLMSVILRFWERNAK
jgi:hypothetical protein